MDVLRGPDFGSEANSGFEDRYGDLGNGTDDVIDMLPPVIGQDERRMQVRAYNYWAGLLGKRRFPSPDQLIAGNLPDFAANAVLLHFSNGIEDPAVLALGSALASECGGLPSIGGASIGRLSDVPGRSVLSRITDHYLQIIANEAPIGFEAEFINMRGLAILYRGILLPFSTDDAKIDYIYGVINWKELADQRTTDELMLEIGHALDRSPVAQPYAAIAPARDMWTGTPDEIATDETRPDGGWADGGWADGPAAFEPDAALDLAPFIDSLRPGQTQTPASEPHTLTEWLEKARASALRAIANEDRTRQSLYAAIARAWDFALAADHAPDDYARLLAEAGLRMQDRAPLIPLVKLVFGADYDKTRLTEYATVLAHARRSALGKGELADFLAQAPGGIKAIIARERAARRGDKLVQDGDPGTGAIWQAAARALPARPLTELSRDGAEFTLVLVRRMPGGDPAMIGEISDNAAMLARAARHISAN